MLARKRVEVAAPCVSLAVVPVLLVVLVVSPLVVTSPSVQVGLVQDLPEEVQVVVWKVTTEVAETTETSVTTRAVITKQATMTIKEMSRRADDTEAAGTRRSTGAVAVVLGTGAAVEATAGRETPATREATTVLGSTSISCSPSRSSAINRIQDSAETSWQTSTTSTRQIMRATMQRSFLRSIKTTAGSANATTPRPLWSGKRNDACSPKILHRSSSNTLLMRQPAADKSHP